MPGAWRQVGGSVKREIRNSLKSFLVELLVYGVLVVGYFFLVLNFLGGWLYRLFEHNRHFYAFIALVLIVGQGFVLEALTRMLLGFIKPRTDD
jgi:hypothetical protein